MVGYNSAGDWLEYTVNVADAGDYDVYASIATENSTSSFSLSIDGQAVAEKVELSGSSFDEFKDVKTTVTLPAGKHILRLEVTGAWFDIDYLDIVKAGESRDAINQYVKLQESNTLQDYYVFDQQGVRMGVLSAYGFDAAAEILQNSSAIKTSGVYYLRSRSTGKMQSVKIVK